MQEKRAYTYIHIYFSISTYIIIERCKESAYIAKIVKRAILLCKGYKYFAQKLERAFRVSSNTQSLLKRGSRR